LEVAAAEDDHVLGVARAHLSLRVGMLVLNIATPCHALLLHHVVMMVMMTLVV